MESNAVLMAKTEELVREIIIQNSIPCYRIESVLDTYKHASGGTVVMPVVRVISYFEDSVSKVADVLSGEFDLTPLAALQNNSIIPLSFSSQLVRFEASLKASRLELIEYKKWAGVKFEIRISSMLQDVWSNIEKNLTSNGTLDIPEDMKRHIYRVSALLETADNDLGQLKNQINERLGISTPQAWQPQATAYSSTSAVSQGAIRMESMDMSVDSFDSLAFSINNVEQATSRSAERMANVLQSMPVIEKAPVHTPQPEPVKQPEPVRQQPEPVSQPEPMWQEPVAITPEPVAPQPEAAKQEGVALNIDNIETFNMNVNGMIEKTTEIIRENTAEKAEPYTNPNLPFLNEEPERKEPVVIDENAQMTDASLKEYVQSSKLLKEIDHMIAERAGAKVNDEIDIEGDVERLKFLKVYTLKQLHEKLTDNKTDIVAFAEKWIGKDNGGSFDSGISLFYLEYLLVGKKNDPAFAVEYVLKFISDNDYSARYIIPTYNSIRQTEAPSNFSHLTLK